MATFKVRVGRLDRMGRGCESSRWNSPRRQRRCFDVAAPFCRRRRNASDSFMPLLRWATSFFCTDMTDLHRFLEGLTLPEAHREALQWFHEHRDQEVAWPSPRPSGIFLVNRAKGIHKPVGSAYALSVRESLGAPYQDRAPSMRPTAAGLISTSKSSPIRINATQCSPTAPCSRVNATGSRWVSFDK